MSPGPRLEIIHPHSAFLFTIAYCWINTLSATPGTAIVETKKIHIYVEGIRMKWLSLYASIKMFCSKKGIFLVDKGLSHQNWKYMPPVWRLFTFCIQHCHGQLSEHQQTLCIYLSKANILDQTNYFNKLGMRISWLSRVAQTGLRCSTCAGIRAQSGSASFLSDQQCNSEALWHKTVWKLHSKLSNK